MADEPVDKPGAAVAAGAAGSAGAAVVCPGRARGAVVGSTASSSSHVAAARSDDNGSDVLPAAEDVSTDPFPPSPPSPPPRGVFLPWLAPPLLATPLLPPPLAGAASREAASARGAMAACATSSAASTSSCAAPPPPAPARKCSARCSSSCLYDMTHRFRWVCDFSIDVLSAAKLRSLHWPSLMKSTSFVSMETICAATAPLSLPTNWR